MPCVEYPIQFGVAVLLIEVAPVHIYACPNVTVIERRVLVVGSPLSGGCCQV